MIDSGDIGSVARWLVGALSSRGYDRDDLVALATLLLDEVRASLEQRSRSDFRSAVAP
jgi:hypothetical protein